MSTADFAGTRGHRSSADLISSLSVGAGLGLLGYSFVRFIGVALKAVRYPYELDYGEGIVWQQMRLMFSGRAYAPVNGYPGIVFHYPPVYHSTVEALSVGFGIDAVAAGRLVTLAATLLSALIIGGLAWFLVGRRSNPRVAALCGGCATLACFTLLPVTFWATVMRVDMLAIFFSMAGLCFAVRSLTRPGEVYAAAFCFVAAVFTKQIAVAAPAAAFATLLFVRPASAWRGILTCLAIGSAVLGALTFATHGGILRHLFLYNVNRFDLTGLELLPAVMLDHGLFFAALTAGAVQIVRTHFADYLREPSWAERRTRLAASTDDAAAAMILLYFVATSAVALLVVKSGANINYLVEWLLVGSIFAGVSVRDAVTQAIGERQRQTPAFAILLPIALGLQALIAGVHAGWQLEVREHRREQLDRLVAMIRAAPRPIISDDMVLLQRGGKDVVIEAAIFAELTGTGRWNERPFIRHILSRDFSFFITEGDRGGREFDSRYTPAVASAIEDAYPAKCRLGGYVIHLPALAVRGFGEATKAAAHPDPKICGEDLMRA